MTKPEITQEQWDNISKIIETGKRKNKNQQGWLNTRDVRPRGMKAEDVRPLMKVVVEIGAAFDNKRKPDDPKYQICFNLEARQQMLEDLEDIDKRSMSDEMDIANRSKIQSMLNYLNECYYKWRSQPIYYRTDGGIWILTHFSIESSTWIQVQSKIGDIFWQIYVILSSHHCFEIDIDDSQMEFIPYNLDEPNVPSRAKDLLGGLRKHAKKYVNIYHALKIGWEEIKHICSFPTHDELFIDLYIGDWLDNLIQTINEIDDSLSIPYRSYSRHLQTINKFKDFLREEIQKSIDSSDGEDRDRYRSILSEMDRDPTVRGCKSALLALCLVVNRDADNNYAYAIDEILGFASALDRVTSLGDDDRSPSNDPSSAVKDAFFRELWSCCGCEYRSTDKVYSYIQDTLAKSINPRVKKALSDWLASDREIYDSVATTTRRLAENPEYRL